MSVPRERTVQGHRFHRSRLPNNLPWIKSKYEERCLHVMLHVFSPAHAVGGRSEVGVVCFGLTLVAAVAASLSEALDSLRLCESHLQREYFCRILVLLAVFCLENHFVSAIQQNYRKKVPSTCLSAVVVRVFGE